MKYKISYRACVLLLLCSSFNAFAQHPVNNAAPLPLDPAVRTGRLPNGFTYYIRHNEAPEHRVLLYLVNKVGSILEDEDQRGLAHFTEHMSFNGTKHFPHNQLVDYLQRSGVRFGADINAYTSYDETVYQLPLPSDKPELLKNGVKIMRDWAQEATLDPQEIDKERGVVLEEKRLGKGASERMQRAYWPLMLNQSRYAQRMPIGLDTVLNNFKRPAIARFYHDWYRPDLQALIVVGDIDVDQIEAMIKMQFASLKNPVNERKRINYTVPLTGKNQFITATDKEMTGTAAEVLIKHRGTELKSANDYRKAVVRALFNQMLAERYAAIGRQANPPFIAGQAGIGDFTGGLGSYTMSVQAKPGELENGLKAAWRETERVKRFGFTQPELEGAKKSYFSSLETALNEKDKTNSASYVTEYQQYFLKGDASPGIKVEYQLAKDELAAISLNEVNGLAKAYITDTNRDILIMAPEKDKKNLPDETTVNGWLKSVAAEALTPYHDEVNTMPFLVAAPAPGKIINEQQDEALNTTTLTLSNGLKVILKPTKYKNDQILFSGFAPGGTSLYADGEYQSAANAGTVIPANGLGNYNTQSLSKFLTGKQLSVRPYISDRFEGISGGMSVSEQETAFQLIYAYFTAPRKDETIFKGIIARTKAALANRGSDPASVFSDTLNAVLTNYNPRFKTASVSQLDQIDLDRAYAIYKERFADAGNFTFTFVGNIDIVAIKPLIEKYLGSLPSTGKHEEAKDLGVHAAEGRVIKTVYKGNEPKATVQLIYTGSYDYSIENNITLDALKECLEIRLLERLREEESGVYAPGVSEAAVKLPRGRYNFTVRFGCAPQNADKLIASTQDEINKLIAAGPRQVDIDKWRAEEEASLTTAMTTNDFWIDFFTKKLQNHEPLTPPSKVRDQIKAVNIQSVKAMASKYLNGQNYIRLVLLPENTAVRK